MEIIKFELEQGRKNRNKTVEIDLYACASELYEELDEMGIIDRIRKVPQLGTMKVNKRNRKSRYDYVMLQLYLHQVIKKELKTKLEFSYGTGVNGLLTEKLNKNEKVSVGDIVQILVIIYNIGHFYNTFTASKAVTEYATQNNLFKQMLINESQDQRYQELAQKLIEKKEYNRLHLLNSYLILERCNNQKISVRIAKNILLAYINESEQDEKTKYIFRLFKNIRTVSYIAYDLQVSNTPLIFDIGDEKKLSIFFNELLAEYNDKEPCQKLVEMMVKLLDDTLYFKEVNVINQNTIMKKIVRKLEKDHKNEKYFEDYFLDSESVLNRKYSVETDYDNENMLKLTYAKEQLLLAEEVIRKLDKLENVRIGTYIRNNGEKTIIVAIKRNCDDKMKIKAAYKIMKYVANIQKNNVNMADEKYLMIVKYFLYYLFGCRNLAIKPTIDEEMCSLCNSGYKKRIVNLRRYLNNKVNEDVRHETEFMISRLMEDKKNDLSVCIPASVEVYTGKENKTKLCEFDGLVIFPNRKEKQLLFLEAKNRDKKAGRGRKELIKKIKKLGLKMEDENQVIKDNMDAYFEYSI